jgi:outer membrane protein OmpA-like peptidoglycan-associated protein/opacity protein-like surface antigen
MNRRLLLATSAALIGLSAAAHAQPVTGPYISLGGGGNYIQDERLTKDSVIGGKLRFDIGETGVAAVGYGFGNGFRVEAEGDYRRNDVRELAFAIPTRAGGRQQNYGGMLNGYFDLDIGSPYVYPYLGLGAGYAQTRLENVSAIDPVSGYTETLGGEHGNFAYQAMFGLSFPVAFLPGLSLTAEYRFYSVLDNGRYNGEAFFTSAGRPIPFVYATGRPGIASDYNHSAIIGLRYALFTPPAPIAAQQAVQTQAAAPTPEPARTYLVFFDWDRADLTARARQIVAEAAQASTHIQSTRIEVDGYTDLSGTAAYNQKLSVRRAQTVQAELVRDGVSAGEITIHGYGESNPLVQTAAGVREPQNRRVEIVIK